VKSMHVIVFVLGLDQQNCGKNFFLSDPNVFIPNIM